MRVVIIGASGFIGAALLRTFGVDAIGTYHSHAAPGLQPLDIRDADAVDHLIGQVRPDVVLHPAAQPHVDWCEDHVEQSYAVNVQGTVHVATAARHADARYVFFSTDYVFNGTSGPYSEDAEPDPLSVYGRHKLEAERAVADIIGNHLIIRGCGVFGFQPEGKNFVMALVARARQRQPMAVPSDQWGTPTYAENLAAALKELVQSPARGVFHLAGIDYLDRVDFARLACDVLRLDAGILRPRTTAELGQAARRPLRGGLDVSKARRCLSTPLLGAREGLELTAACMRAAGYLS